MYVVRTRCVDYHYTCDFIFIVANQSGMHANCTGIAGCITTTIIYLYTVQACCVENLIQYLCLYNSEHLVHVKSFLKLLLYELSSTRCTCLTTSIGTAIDSHVIIENSCGVGHDPVHCVSVSFRNRYKAVAQDSSIMRTNYV